LEALHCKGFGSMGEAGDTPPHARQAARLSGLAISGQLLFYLLSIVLARRLGTEGFEHYAVAVAAVTLPASFATLGLEKYAMRVLPACYERGDWPRARGYLRFSVGRVFGASLVAAAAVGIGWARWAADSEGAATLAIIVGAVSLPAVALVQYGVEVLSANGYEARATMIYRVVVPACAIGLIGLALLLSSKTGFELTGAVAVGCWGLAWLVAMIAMFQQVQRTVPSQVWSSPPLAESGAWHREALPFLIYGVALTFIFQVGVIALERLQSSSAAVGAYLASAQTASVMVVLATATNRFYSPRLSVLLERRDFAAIDEMRRERLRWIVPAVAACLLATFFFGREILETFHPDFASEGLVALRVLVLSSAFSTLFSVSPTYLNFVRRNHLVLGTATCAAMVQLALLVVLVPRFGATGAAIAFSAAICGMYAVFAVVAVREVSGLRSRQGDAR
jgi:O-antigen/teichoic acid export membrane protein